jgi:hypothetical protein
MCLIAIALTCRTHAPRPHTQTVKEVHGQRNTTQSGTVLARPLQTDLQEHAKPPLHLRAADSPGPVGVFTSAMGFLFLLN